MGGSVDSRCWGGGFFPRHLCLVLGRSDPRRIAALRAGQKFEDGAHRAAFPMSAGRSTLSRPACAPRGSPASPCPRPSAAVVERRSFTPRPQACSSDAHEDGSPAQTDHRPRLSEGAGPERDEVAERSASVNMLFGTAAEVRDFSARCALLSLCVALVGCNIPSDGEVAACVRSKISWQRDYDFRPPIVCDDYVEVIGAKTVDHLIEGNSARIVANVRWRARKEFGIGSATALTCFASAVPVFGSQQHAAYFRVDEVSELKLEVGLERWASGWKCKAD